MEIVVKFPAKSKSSRIKEVIEIAKKQKYEFKNDIYYIYFEKKNNELQRLLEIIENWRNASVLLDGKEVTARELHGTLYCKYKNICDGVCKHWKYGLYIDLEYLRDLKNLIKEEKILVKNNTWFVDKYVIERFSYFLENHNTQEYKLNKEKLHKWIRDEFWMEEKYCEKFDVEKIKKIISGLPDVFVEIPLNRFDELTNIIKCPKKSFCEGECSHLLFNDIPIKDYLKNFVENDVGIIDEDTFFILQEYFEKENGNSFRLDREKFKKFVEEKLLDLEFKYCDIIDKEKTLALIDELPEYFTIKEEKPIGPQDLEEIINKSAEIFADALEKRLRKLFDEYFRKEKYNKVE